MALESADMKYIISNLVLIYFYRLLVCIPPRLADALTQKTNAEAVMIRSFRAHQILSRLTGTSAEDVGVALLDRVHDGNARARGLECVVHDGKDIYLDVSKSAGLAAVVEMHKLFLRDLTCRTTEYAALWATFVAERGIILTTRSTNLTWGKALKDWERGDFAACAPSLQWTKQVRTKSSRAVIQGSKWCTEQVESSNKACDSIIMIKSDVEGISAEFGRVQDFYNVPLPGIDPDTVAEGQESDAHRLYIAGAHWFRPVGMNEAIGCPVVQKEYKNDPAGNFWELGAIVPTKIALAPHHQNHTWWQVLHTDSDFLTREYWR
eukprot:353464-Chlamydomonas_euryale.AAC.2